MNYLKKAFSKSNIIVYIIIIGLVAIDLITKLLIQTNMALGDSQIIINGILNFTFILNKGGAWGIFSQANATIWLAFISLIFAIIMFCVNIVIKNKNLLYYFSFCLILSGTIGNMIDRFTLNAVRDFIEVDFISFPVFNIADIFLVVGVILFCMWYLILMFREDSNQGKSSSQDKT